MRKSPTAAWLFVEKGARAGVSARLESSPALIGRDPGAELRLDPHEDLVASGRHAMVTPSGEGWEIRDLGSRNGTWVNGERLTGSRVLEPGDRIRLGDKGPVVLFTDRPPEGAGVSGGRRTPATRAAPAARPRRRGLLIGAGVGALGLLGVVAVWASRAPTESSAEDLPPTSRSAAPVLGNEPIHALPGPDTAAARRDAEMEALRRQVAEIMAALERSERESERLREALASAQRRGASGTEVDSLVRELRESNAQRQASEAQLRRQQLAGSIDYDEIAAGARPATAQVFVEFEGGQVIAATAFSVDPGGRLLTNRHVIRRRDDRAVLRVAVQYADTDAVLRARIAAVSPAHDLAVIEVVEPTGGMPAVGAFNERVDTLSLPAPVVLFGFPLGGEGGPGAGVARPLVSAGVLVGRQGDALELEGFGRVGASGSPILDAAGQVIGVLMGGRTMDDGERLYAVPASRVLGFLRAVSGSGR